MVFVMLLVIYFSEANNEVVFIETLSTYIQPTQSIISHLGGGLCEISRLTAAVRIKQIEFSFIFCCRCSVENYAQLKINIYQCLRFLQTQTA